MARGLEGKTEAGIAGPVLVTGGTGFLGGGIVHALRARGIATHVLARASSERGALDGLGVTWHVGDLTDAAAVARAVAGTVEVAGGAPVRVVHSGALISSRSADGEAQRRINVDGTRYVLDAARRQGVARLVHVSSVVAVGHAADGEPLDERAEFNSGHLGVDYVDTKRAAEELALAAARHLDVVVVNPGAIFGKVSRASNSARFLRETMAGKGPPFAPPGGVGVLGVEDAVAGTLLALERGRRGERYILVESNLAALELFRLVAELADVKPVRAALPQWLWRIALAGARIVDRVRPLELAPPQAMVLLGKKMWFDAGKARAELGWSPEPFRQVLERTLADLREQETEKTEASAHGLGEPGVRG
jgi:dihydroflavonol-4-reductase